MKILHQLYYFLLIFNGLFFLLIQSQKSKNVADILIQSLTDMNENSFENLLQEIMLKTLTSYQCVSILMDATYYNKLIIQLKWFKKFENFITYFMIYKDEFEDLLDPYNETQNSLIMAKNYGCEMYIILLTSGMQMGRLLQFGDENRLLNTRSNYILLYDKSLFKKSLLYLWRRIINVVFIKKFNGRIKKTYWYELTTVPFPIDIQEEILIPRRLDIWTKGKFRKGYDLFRDKTNDLTNQTLRVVTFAHLPGTEKNQSNNNSINENKGIRANLNSLENNTFFGLEIEILTTIAKVMNFNCELYEPENADVELWGRNKELGYTGLLGEMYRAKADLALGDLYYISYMLNILDLSIPYNTECLTFLTPESLTDISWKTLILPFSPIMWTCVLICLLITSIAFYILAKFQLFINNVNNNNNNKNYDKRRKEYPKKNLIIKYQMHNMDDNMKYSLLKEEYKRVKNNEDPEGLYQFSEPGNSILYTYSMLLLVSLPKLPSGWSLRVLTGWYWLYCLLLVVTYRASMTAILSKPTPRITIDTLEELITSKLTFGGCGEINTEFFESSPDNFFTKIKRKFEIVNNSDYAVNLVSEGNFAFYENIYFLKDAIFKKESNQNVSSINNPSISSRNLHIMKDCIINMPVSIGLQKNSPIKLKVDKIIRKVLEAGLVEKWLNDAMPKKLEKIWGKNGHFGQKALMNLEKMYGAIVVLGIGYILGILSVTAEIIYYHRSILIQLLNEKFRVTAEILKIAIIRKRN